MNVAQSRVGSARQEGDPFDALSDEDMGLIGPVFHAALQTVPRSVAVPLEAAAAPMQADCLSDDVMRYLGTLQTALASVQRDAVDVGISEALATSPDEATALLAQSFIDSLLSGGPSDLAAPGIASGTTASSTILGDNPLLLGMLEAPTVTSSAYDAYRLPSTVSASFGLAAPQCQPAWHDHALGYAVTAQTLSVAPVSSSSIDEAFAEYPAQATTIGPSPERVSETTNLLRLLAAVARRDIELPHTVPMEDDEARYDARYLLCAAYRAIILNVPRNRGWLPVKRFTDALGLDASAFARWTSLYRRDDEPSNAFWDTLAPHVWVDAFALIDRLEAQHGGLAPTLGDLVRTPLYGQLCVGRIKRPRAQLHGIGYGPPNGSADPVPHEATAVSPVPTFEALRDIARSVRLVAAASNGDIVAERTETLLHEARRRYDPRHLLIAIHGALDDNLRDGGSALSLRLFSRLVGLNPRTVYAWRYSHLRNGTPGVALARRVVAGSGTDQRAFVACLKTVMQERAPHEVDLRATLLHDRILQRFESTLGLSASDLQEDRARRVKALPLPGVPEAMREMTGMMRHVVALPFRTPASAPASCTGSDHVLLSAVSAKGVG